MADDVRAQLESASPEALAEAISALPENEKLVFSLVYYEEHDLDQVASMLGASTDDVAEHEERALLRIWQAVKGASA